MPDSILNSPITNPLTIRASAALAAAGAWDTTPLELAVGYKTRASLFITYTRGAAGGAFDFQAQYSPYSLAVAGVQNWFAGSEYSAAVLAAGVDSQSRLQREYITYQSQGAAAETVVYGPIDIDATVERVRFQFRESGVVATPGIVHCVAIAYSEQ